MEEVKKNAEEFELERNEKKKVIEEKDEKMKETIEGGRREMDEAVEAVTRDKVGGLVG